MTIPNRREDLVFITNGIPSNFINYAQSITNDLSDSTSTTTTTAAATGGIDTSTSIPLTTSVPHFGVLKVGGNPISNKEISPSTIIHGKHADKLQNILESNNIRVEISSSVMDVDAAAIRKLIWVSAMWLLCHDDNTGQNCSSSNHNDAKEEYKSRNVPMDVNSVHKFKEDELRILVANELYPAALALLEQYHDNSLESVHGVHDNNDERIRHNIEDVMGTINEVMDYLVSYSSSMPGAIPNKELAIDEIEQRNGILLSTSVSQPLHEALIQRVTKMDKLLFSQH